MAEKLVNEFTVNRPIGEAWPVITDVERIAPCLPGAQLTEIEDDVYRGNVKIKLGSVTPQFRGEAKYLERDDDAHRAILKADGRDTGGRGNASATITAQAESLSPTSTRVIVTTDLHITGKVAQFGRGIIGDVSKKLMAQFANNLNTMLDDDRFDDDSNVNGAAPDAGDPDAGQPGAAADGAVTAAVSAPDPSTAPSGNGTSTASPSPTPLTSSPPASSPAGPAGGVRRIDSPASEPVDLAGLAGPAVLKRLLPVLLAALAGLFVLRRRRS